MAILIKNATIVNEGKIFEGSVVIEGEKIASITPVEEGFAFNEADYQVVDAKGLLLLPGVIDTHVHFRDSGAEPLAHADFASESCAAVAGGVTSVVDMPNTTPQTTTLELLEQKEHMAASKSVVNYGFMLGATNDNIDQLLAVDPKRYAAIKLFLGSSTGNMLVNNPEMLDKLFRESKKLIVAHCESEEIIQNNQLRYRAEYGSLTAEQLKAYNEQLKRQYEEAKAQLVEDEAGNMPKLPEPLYVENLAQLHPQIRNTEACYLSTYRAIERALKYKTRFHVAHITTATELGLLTRQPLHEKHITAEVTPNHLWFDDRDYIRLGNLIKCNPAIKSNDDRLALWAALYDGYIDTIGSDHAPHPLENKQKNYFDAPGGIPSLQHTLPMMLETFFNPVALASEEGENAGSQQTGSAFLTPLVKEWVPMIVEKMSHNPALLFGIADRGFIREGYRADLVLVNPIVEEKVNQQDLRYKCGWSPLVGETFHTRVEKTFVNGQLAYDHDNPTMVPSTKGEPLQFIK